MGSQDQEDIELHVGFGTVETRNTSPPALLSLQNNREANEGLNSLTNQDSDRVLFRAMANLTSAADDSCPNMTAAIMDFTSNTPGMTEDERLVLFKFSYRYYFIPTITARLLKHNSITETQLPHKFV